MLVKDEADIIRATVEHLLLNVDHILLLDNMSRDGTRDILEEIRAGDPRLEIHDDWEVGYFQDFKTTELAHHAFLRGFSWVLPCDADEIWYATDGRSISDFLDGVAPDAQMITAPLYNHLPSSEDEWGNGTDPVAAIGWRQREHQDLRKICCRARPDLKIGMGNHRAKTTATGLTIEGGIVIRHFSWRTAAQYVKKIRNGIVAYAATNYDESQGEHWRDKIRFYELNGTTVDQIAAAAPGDPLPGDEGVAGWFSQWFYSDRPRADETLIYDPAPIWRRSTHGGNEVRRDRDEARQPKDDGAVPAAGER